MSTMAIHVPVNAQKRASPKRPAMLALPAVLLVLVFFGLPLLEIFIRSLTDPELGFQNYIWMLTSETTMVIAFRTFTMALIVSLICVVIAFPYAYLMRVAGERERRWLTLFVLLPLYSSILVRTLAWFILLQDKGPINDVLTWIGIGPLPLIRTTFGVALGMTQILLPFVVLPLYATMEKIDLRLMLAARSLGCTPARAFWSVYLPLTKPGLISGATSVFILSLGFFIIPTMLGSPANTLLPSLIYQQISGFLLWGQGTALGVGLLVVTLVLLAVGTRLAGNKSIISGGK